ncbi:uncharacterized protein N7479_007913 [Penicillium vulpinum]|uniref:uncharacterized protein n=1 Tax=Penicillium vulpinum TaxID=29845 RepID=UPI002548C87F|nr:uncharacterized protein N7479_007913 [Penicillium vulpinum]KAJ5960763.1 hypothetical protein N7479_007913 [Penicillium vulpinum]
MGRHQQIPKITWSLQVGLPIPTSSASISDLDQAAGLATAFAFLLAAPLQFVMLSVGRALWASLVALITATTRVVGKLPWLTTVIEAVSLCLELPSHIIKHDARVITKAESMEASEAKSTSLEICNSQTT